MTIYQYLDDLHESTTAVYRTHFNTIEYVVDTTDPYGDLIDSTENQLLDFSIYEINFYGFGEEYYADPYYHGPYPDISI